MNKPKVILLSFILNLIILSSSFSEIIKKIQITGNTRISDETVLMFSKIDVGQNFESSTLNKIKRTSQFGEYVAIKINTAITPAEAPIIAVEEFSNTGKNVQLRMKLTPPTKTPKKQTLKKVFVVNKFKNNLEEKNSKYIFQNK